MIIHPQSWGGGGRERDREMFISNSILLFFSLSRGAKVTLKCWQLS